LDNKNHHQPAEKAKNTENPFSPLSIHRTGFAIFCAGTREKNLQFHLEELSTYHPTEIVSFNVSGLHIAPRVNFN